jgi:predicted alpha/beta superfamily hydrolase
MAMSKFITMIRLLIFLSFIGTHAAAQSIVNDQLTIGTEAVVYSRILHEKRTIWISVPKSMTDTLHAKQKYPVVYLLDGNNHFATVSSMLKQLSVENGNVIFPEMIVVGILNTDRVRDFTPTSSSFWVFKGFSSEMSNTGGGDQFVKFLQKELIPHIDSIYPTAPYRVLMGHSLAGLETTNVLINHTSLFNAYIIVDPSLWYDNRKLLSQAQLALQKNRFDSVRLYLGIANTMPSDMDTVSVRKDTCGESFHMRSILLFRDVLEKTRSNGLHFACHYYGNDGHMSAPLITVYDGLRFIFDYYAMPDGIMAKLYDPGVDIDPVPIFQLHFQQVSAQIGYQVLPPENLVNLFANSLLEYRLYKKVFLLLNLNIQNYPHSSGAYDAMGDYYRSQTKYTEAIRFYQKALQVKGSASVRTKLAEIYTLQKASS